MSGEHALKPLHSVDSRESGGAVEAKQSDRIAESLAGAASVAGSHRKHGAASSALTLPSTLKLTKMTVADDEKDAGLYYFLTRFPGRTLVFVNRIGSTKRLAGILDLLGVPVYALHAKMQQR